MNYLLKKKINKILAFDISTASTGWALKDYKNNEVNTGRIEKPSELDGLEAIVFEACEIKKIIDGAKPDLIIMEDTYLRFNYRTVKLMDMLRGWVFIYSIMKKIDVAPSYNTLHVRKILGINKLIKKNMTRKQKKQMVINFLNSLGYKVKQDDEADALAMILAFEKEKYKV